MRGTKNLLISRQLIIHRTFSTPSPLRPPHLPHLYSLPLLKGEWRMANGEWAKIATPWMLVVSVTIANDQDQ